MTNIQSKLKKYSAACEDVQAESMEEAAKIATESSFGTCKSVKMIARSEKCHEDGEPMNACFECEYRFAGRVQVVQIVVRNENGFYPSSRIA